LWQVCDNCELASNHNQLNSDGDALGDGACGRSHDIV
jgi:hypothetical protein